MIKSRYRQKLCEVTIRGYKSIAYNFPITLGLGDISILLGANGAGKSNIVSFFKMISFMMSRKFANYVEMSGTSNSILHYGPQKTPTLSGNLKFLDDNSTDTYSFTLANAAPDRLIITEECVTWFKNGKTVPYKVHLEPDFKESSLVDSSNRVARSIYNMLSAKNDERFINLYLIDY